jgi:hypothetical protein
LSPVAFSIARAGARVIPFFIASLCKTRCLYHALHDALTGTPGRVLFCYSPGVSPTAGKVATGFAPVIKAFAKDPAVTQGGKAKGFGASGLKVKGKLFAMISSRGLFVAKLPRERVQALVASGKGRPFDPGHGRLMKEWIEVDGDEASWVGLAREARRFVGGAKAK